MTNDKFITKMISSGEIINHPSFSNLTEIVVKKSVINVKDIKIAKLTDAETHFRAGAKLLIDSTLPPKKRDNIIFKLARGQQLSDGERQHVLIAQEFYRAHEQMFLSRARETAFTAREVEFIAKTLAAAKGQPVLDVGCGLGRLTIPLLKMGYNMYGIDVAPNLVARAKKEAPQYQERFLVANLFHLPFRTNYFSAVTLMWHVICEVSHNLDAVFSQLRLMIKPGGILIFDLPDASSDMTRIKYKGPPGQENYAVFLAKIPPMSSLKQALDTAGFKILHIEHFLWGIHKFVIVCKKM